METRINDIDKRLATLEQRVSNVEGSMDRMIGKMENLAESNTQVMTILPRLEAKVSEIWGALSVQQTALAAQNSEVKRLNARDRMTWTVLGSIGTALLGLLLKFIFTHVKG